MNDAPPSKAFDWGALKADFTPRTVVATLLTGLVLAMVNTLLTVALVSLIFRGELADSAPLGIGLGLVSSAALGLVVAVRSSFSGSYAGVQDASAAILGLSSVSIAGALVGPTSVSTVVAMVAVTSLATGLVLLVMGHLGWGEIARFVPFPVIGGLLAGTGYLIMDGALGIVGVGSVEALASPDGLGLVWPAAALAVAFFLASRRSWRPSSYLAFLVVAIAGFHALTRIGGVSRAGALERGWLLGPFPDGGLWPGSVLPSVLEADWELIGGEAAGLTTILIVVPITLLLYISALEVETKVDVDVNRELRATGWGNIAAGLLGGPPGYMYLGDTAITAKVLGPRRGPALIAPVAVVGIVALGGTVLELLPTFVIGGLLLFVGAEFAYEWLWKSRRRMSVLDYLLMLVIVLVIASVGFLSGVVSGLVAAILLFVVRYSRTDVIKHEFTGAERRSNIDRSIGETDYLTEHGSAMHALELQGFIFFGTASQILNRFRAMLGQPDPPVSLVMDFKRITGIDSSAVAVFERVALFARDRGIRVLLTGLTEAQLGQFADLTTAYRDVISLQPDLDHGLAFCEELILADVEFVGTAQADRLRDLVGELGAHLEHRRFDKGDVLMRQGDPSPGLYLIRSGQATVLLDVDGRASTRLRTLLPGTVLGEISLYRDEPCVATVVVDEESEILHLTPDGFAALCSQDPAGAAKLHAFVARVLAGRVSHANKAIQVLLE